MTHLASTMGVKTLLLLNSNPDWRWHIELKEKCFYDNLEIIKADKINDWESVSLKISFRSFIFWICWSSGVWQG